MTMYQYSIYQLPVEDNGCFRPMRKNDDGYYPVDMSNYDKVHFDTYFSEDETKDEVLEQLFMKFNFGDYPFRSMSVSDIIKLNDEYYFVDSIGFLKITRID